MKYILILLLAFSFSANAQTDSSKLQLPIKLTLRVKYWALLGNYLTVSSPVADTALKCVGSGNVLDSISTGTIRAGRFLQFLQRWSSERGGEIYTDLDQLVTSTAANGGLIAQLNVHINNGTATQKAIASWLKSEVLKLIASLSAVNDERKTIGIQNLKDLQNNATD